MGLKDLFSKQKTPIVKEVQNQHFQIDSYSAIGDIIKFGEYPQGINGERQPIEWLVLDKYGPQLTLISKYILDCQNFDNKNKWCSWETSSIRQWLNGYFYNTAFDEQDKKNIMTVDSVDNSPEEYTDPILYQLYRSKYFGDLGGHVFDKVNLMSFSEYKKYLNKFANEDISNNGNFLEDSFLKAFPTQYLQGKNIPYYKGSVYGGMYYWLRTPAFGGRIYIIKEGLCSMNRDNSIDPMTKDLVKKGVGLGIRPMIKIIIS